MTLDNLKPGDRVSLRPGSYLLSHWNCHLAEVVAGPTPYGVAVAVLDTLNGLTTRPIATDLASAPAVVVQLPLPVGPLLVAVPLEDVRVMETVAVN